VIRVGCLTIGVIPELIPELVFLTHAREYVVHEMPERTGVPPHGVEQKERIDRGGKEMRVKRGQVATVGKPKNVPGVQPQFFPNGFEVVQGQING